MKSIANGTDHAALLVLELFDERARWFRRSDFNPEDVQAVRGQCVFTTYTRPGAISAGAKPPREGGKLGGSR